MVGGAGNAPVVTSDVYFSTLVLQTSSRIASRNEVRSSKQTRNPNCSTFEFRISNLFRVSSFGFRVFEMVAGVGVAPTEAEIMRLA
jgi:hypothetical protein